MHSCRGLIEWGISTLFANHPLCSLHTPTPVSLSGFAIGQNSLLLIPRPFFISVLPPSLFFHFPCTKYHSFFSATFSPHTLISVCTSFILCPSWIFPKAKISFPQFSSKVFCKETNPEKQLSDIIFSLIITIIITNHSLNAFCIFPRIALI